MIPIIPDRLTSTRQDSSSSRAPTNKGELGQSSVPNRTWWPFWIVMALYVPVRIAFVNVASPLSYIAALCDPFTLPIAVVVGFAARKIPFDSTASQSKTQAPAAASRNSLLEAERHPSAQQAYQPLQANSLTEKIGKLTKAQRLRIAEYGLLVFVFWGFGRSTGWEWSRFRFPPERWLQDWVELLLLIACCGAPILLRPLTHIGATTQQRYAVCGFVLAAGLAWLLWISEALGRSTSSSGLAVFSVVSLLGVAGYLRISWNRIGD